MNCPKCGSNKWFVRVAIDDSVINDSAEVRDLPCLVIEDSGVEPLYTVVECSSCGNGVTYEYDIEFIIDIKVTLVNFTE